MSNPRIFLSAGEASGDHYGAQVIAALRTSVPDAAFFGLGGREMEDAGLDRVVRAEDVAHMGITEVIRHMPRVWGSYRRLVASIKEQRPHAAVLIDFPDVNLRLARELKALGIPVIYFVSPQLWAWKRRRLQWVQERVDRMMVIFPFEEPFYRARGVNATFVGHPLIELPLPEISREAYAARHKIDPARPWVALLPGSRGKEVRSNLPTMLDAAAQISPNGGIEFLLPVASTLDSAWVREQTAAWSTPEAGKSAPRLSNLHLVEDAREALFHARASVVASGTATVQAATIGNPFVVVYRVSPLTFAAAKKLIRYPAEIPAIPDAHGNLPIGMVNLIAERRIVTELIQQQFTADNLATALRRLLDDSSERSQMIADLADVRRKLLSPSRSGAISQVAEAVLEQLSAEFGATQTAGGRNSVPSV
ncbi:MAG TPA: lipid-A-disaccharide synthase [Edaphobacter sp.]